MRNKLLVACLMILPWLATAQEKTVQVAYQPGKWYAGLQLATYNFNNTNDAGIGAGNSGLMALLGKRLSRHFDVQVGLLLPSRQSSGSIFQLDNPTDTTTLQVVRVYGKPLFIPITLHYLPFGSQHRFQPYLAVGFSSVIGRVKKQTMLYNSQAPVAVYDFHTDNEGVKVLFGAQAGFGMNIRLIERLHLTFEVLAGRNLSTGGNYSVSTESGGFGLDYEFPAR